MNPFVAVRDDTSGFAGRPESTRAMHCPHTMSLDKEVVRAVPRITCARRGSDSAFAGRNFPNDRPRPARANK